MVDQIFSYFELGFQEVETSRYVTRHPGEEQIKVEPRRRWHPHCLGSRRYGNGEPVIAFMADIDHPPRFPETGRSYHDPIIEGRARPGEGHNAGQAVNVTAALALQVDGET